MSKPQETTDGDSEDQSEPAQVEDIEDLIQRLEIKQIQTARQKVMDMRNDVSESIVQTNSANRQEAIRNGAKVYLDTVKTLCLRLSPLLKQHYQELWEETRLMEGVEEFDRNQHGNQFEHDKIVAIEPQQQTFAVDGIQTLVGNKFPIPVDFEVTVYDSAQGNTPKTVQQVWVPDMHKIDNVVVALDEARHDLGLGVAVSEGSDVARADYSDIV